MLEPENLGRAELQNGPRGDHLSGWSLIVLGVVVFIQLLSQLDVNIAKLGEKFHVPGSLSVAATSDDQPVRADAKDTLGIDAEAKSAYAWRCFGAKADYRLDSLQKTALQKAVQDAETQLQQFKSDRAVARRVMILRAENNEQPLMAVSADRQHAAIEPPLCAFDSANPRQKEEAAAWRALFSYKSLPPGTKPEQIERVIRSHESLGWYMNLALHQLWLRGGQLTKAQQYLDTANRSAVCSILPLTLMCGIVLVVGLSGLAIIAALAVRGLLQTGLPEQAPESILDELATPLPDRITSAERKMGAGDLFNVFVVCMLIFVLISYAVEYVPAKLLFPMAYAALSARAKINAVVAMVSCSQLMSTVVAFAIVLGYARSKGASVGQEIGLSLVEPLKNVWVGIIGWGVSLPLIYAASSLALKLFPNLPDPSNPAIPLTTQSSGFLAHAALFVTVCILAPVFEEIMFRGLFYQTARAKLGPWPAIVLTGVVFGLVHPVSIVGSLPLMLLGGVLAWLAETRKSLLPGMVAHSLQNTMVYLSMLFLS